MCSVIDCTKTRRTKLSPYCDKHYFRFRRNGDPMIRSTKDLLGPPICSQCGRKKTRKIRGTTWQCKPCWNRIRREENAAKPVRSRAVAVRRRCEHYGIPVELWVKLQSRGCMICGRKAGLIQNQLHFDHDHITGEVRGLLCNQCNRGIGYLRDDPELIMKAYKYLTEPRVLV